MLIKLLYNKPIRILWQFVMVSGKEIHQNAAVVSLLTPKYYKALWGKTMSHTFPATYV